MIDEYVKPDPHGLESQLSHMRLPEGVDGGGGGGVRK